MKKSKNRIKAVDLNSIARELGIKEGDSLVSIDHEAVVDVFDYSLKTNSAELIVEIEKENGEIIEFDIEKDEFEDLGIVFEQPLMAAGKSCANRCVFCFIDQMPSNMRESLYFKDDDIRLSFLSGNYVTLTNIGDKELDRIISYKLSPVNISVHATNPELRVRMLGNKNAGAVLDQLGRITRAGIWINCQIVLCPGINDGLELQRTLQDIFALGDKVMSVAIVPVGLTRYRTANCLPDINPVGRTDALEIIKTVDHWQKVMLGDRGERIIFASDEIYIKAGVDFPPADEYEGFPQLENGVGIVPLFLKEMHDGINKRIRRDNKRKNINGIQISSIRKNNNNKTRNMLKRNSENTDIPVTKSGDILIVTGVDAKPYIEKFTAGLTGLYGPKFEVMAIPNRFFGETVTVAGLVTGSDIVYELDRSDACEKYSKVIIPSCMLRSGEDVFLDGMSVSDVQNETEMGILCVEPTGEGLLGGLDKLFNRE